MPSLQADQVPALVQAGVLPGGIGTDAVLGEAAADVLRVALEHHPHAKADIVGQLLPVALQQDTTSTWPLWCSCPPSARGRMTAGRSSMLASRYARP